MARFSIPGAGTQSATATTGTYKGLRFSLTCTTIADITTSLLEAINVLVTYQQANGGNHTIVSSNLLALALANNIGNYELLNIDGTINCIIGFGDTPLNLSPGDSMTVTVTVGTTATGLVTTVATDATVGIMEWIPVVQVFSVDPNRTNYSVSLGNNVTRVAIVNDAATSITASQRFTSIQFQSDAYNDDYIAQDLQALMAEQWPRDPNFYACALYQGPAVRNATLNININTSATSNAWIVSYGGVVNGVTRENLAKTVQKVAAKEAANFLPA